LHEASAAALLSPRPTLPSSDARRTWDPENGRGLGVPV